MFRRSAQFYDFLYGGLIGRVYEEDAEEIHALIQRHSPGASSLLDVACGTGGHLAILKQHYQAAGFDLAPEMVAIARECNPDLEIAEADMQDFEMGRTFDAVTCLFSSIGYADGVAGLERAVAAMARHTAPGGVVMVESWFEPDQWVEGHIAIGKVERDGRSVVRMSRSTRQGRKSHMEFHYLVGTADGIEYFVEPHEMTLFSRGEYEAAFTEAGLGVTRDGEALLGRGLYIGTRTG